MFKAEWSMGHESFEPIRALRASIGMDCDMIDGYAAHVYVFEDDGSPIASGRMYPDGDAVRIDRLAVADGRHSLPYAEFVLRVLLYKAKDMPQTYLEVEPADDILALLPLFGFARATDAPNIMRCKRDELTWFSECKHGEK